MLDHRLARRGGFKADTPQFAGAIFGQQDDGGFLYVQLAAAPFEQTTALLCDRFDQADAVHFAHIQIKAFGEAFRIARQQVVGEMFGYFFLDHRVASDRVNRREHIAVFFMFDLGPHQSGGIGQRHVVVDLVALLRLGDSGFVADIGNAALEQHIHQCGFADIGYAHDHQAQWFMIVVAMRGERLAETGYFRCIGRALAAECDGFHAFLPVVIVQPLLRDDRIGEVDLVEYLQTRALAVFAQLADHRVATRLGRARIQHFDDHVREFHRFGRFSAGRGHVTRKPLYCHVYLYKSIFWANRGVACSLIPSLST